MRSKRRIILPYGATFTLGRHVGTPSSLVMRAPANARPRCTVHNHVASKNRVRLLSLITHLQPLKWPLWGVLLTGSASALLWEHPDRFRGHRFEFLFLLSILPIFGGVLTPDKPEYTCVVFAVGSIPPVGTDIPPFPIGLWLLAWLRAGLGGDVHAFVHPFLPTAFAIALAMMSTAFAPMVYLGWFVRCKCKRLLTKE